VGGLNPYLYAEANPYRYADIYGLWAIGLNVGGGVSIWGIHISTSFAVIVDSKGISGIIITPEVGVGTEGVGGFARVLYASGENSFDTLNGIGLSGSASAGPASASVSLPYRRETSCDEKGKKTTLGSYPPVIEFGIGKGRSQVSATLGYGIPIGRNRVIGNTIDAMRTFLGLVEGVGGGS